MPDIWQQFHRLPRPIRDAVAAPSALATIDRLEQQYPNLDTAGLVMRVMVKAVPVDKLTDTIANEGKIDGDTAEQVATVLRREVFLDVADYLGLQTAPPTLPPSPVTPPPNTPLPTPPPAPAPIRPAEIRPTAPSPAMPVVPPLPAIPTTPKPASTPPVEPVTLRPRVPAPLPSAPLAAAPTQAYSDDDAKEIAEQSQRLQQLATSTTVQDFDDISRQVLDQHQIAFPEELFTKRALAILKARLKDIRPSDETRDLLTRDPKVGGLGLDPDLAANVVASLETRATDLKSRGMVAPRAIPAPPLPPPVPSVTQTRPEPKPPLHTFEAPDNLPVAPVTTPPPSFTEPARPSQPIRRPPDLPAPPPMAATLASPASTPTVQRSRVLERPRVADVSRPNRTFGPAEEMRSLTLAEFRRLGQGAGESTRKLLDKFRHLQQESFKLWADAISGWRQSDVYRLYLDMGRDSLEQNIAITEIIQGRARKNQPYLSEHEFTALADLNRQLQH